MKTPIKTLFAALALIVLCSFGNNKPSKVQRRKGVMNVDAQGKVTFTPLDGPAGVWQDFTPVNDSIYQYRKI